MSTPLPSNEEARSDRDRHIKRTVAIRALYKISDMVSELEKQDRLDTRVLVIGLVALLIIAICAGVAVYFASERYKARNPVTHAAPVSVVAHVSHRHDAPSP